MDHSDFRKIPPLRALKAFESAARHLSFTQAAKELHVTQAAVSHQIKVLEENLETRLFKRLNRTLLLTDDGQQFLPEVRATLEQLATATLKLRKRKETGSLTVSILPSFAAKWLVPRLWKFQQQYPDLIVRISAFEWLVDFDKEEVDLAIRSGRGVWKGLVAHPLLKEDFFPVCSPKLMQHEPELTSPEDLQHYPLLHDDFFRDDWRIWLSAAGVSHIDPDRGISYSHTSMVLDAAIRGHGIAMGRTPLVDEDLAAGRLVKPFDITLPSDFAYYIVYPESRKDDPKLTAFRDWLLSEA
ncbi:MAG: transcriptional regulator GcvA [bacterium]